MLPGFSADNLLPGMMRSISRCNPLRRLKPNVMETVRALSQPERFILVIVELGMQEAARRYGVDLKVLEAGATASWLPSKHKSTSVNSGAQGHFARK